MPSLRGVSAEIKQQSFGSNLIAAVAQPKTSSSASTTGSGCSGGGVICIENPLRTNSLAELIQVITNLIFTLAVAVAPFMILWAAFLFVTGAGDPKNIDRAKKILLWTAIGLLLAVLSRGLISLLETAIGV